MTPSFLHINPDIFPDPYSFIPERWLNLNGTESKCLEHYLVPYSKGPRQCSALKSAPFNLSMFIFSLAPVE